MRISGARATTGISTNILELRRDIARRVAQEVRAALRPEDERRLGRRDTVNPEAFDHYLRAIELRSRGQDKANTRASLDAARKAIGLDPEFAQAYVELTYASSTMRWMRWDRNAERASEASAAAAKALELEPELPEAHWAKGVVLYQLDLDYERALKEFSLALEGNPSDSRSLAYMGYVRRRQGRPGDTAALLERAVAVNPLDATLSFNLGETYALLRSPDDAERFYRKALQQNPSYRPAPGL